jgi:predicted DsbA family dithiol-disulfide isomerase
MKQRLMELYFSEGADLSDREVLVKAAADCGLNADDVRRRLATDEDVARIETEAGSANEAGIQGVPFFIFGNLLAVSGAHPPEHLAQAIEKAANEFAKQVAAE